MFGSGAMTGTAFIHHLRRLIQQDLQQALTACCAAAAGTAAPSTVALPTGNTAVPTIDTTTSASAWFFHSFICAASVHIRVSKRQNGRSKYGNRKKIKKISRIFWMFKKMYTFATSLKHNNKQ
jgi:hypothetical protein